MNLINKGIWIRTIAILLVVTVFATVLPSRMTVRAETAASLPETAFTTDPETLLDDILEQTVSQGSAVDALYEDTDLRTSNSKILRLNDGTYKLGSYGFNVHFQAQEGFVEYDNTLVRKGDTLTPTRSDIDLSFASDRPAYSIGFDGVTASFELINEELKFSEAVVSGLPKQEHKTKEAELFAVRNAKAQLEYAGSPDGVSFTYLIYGRNVKENIVLHKLPDASEFRFLIRSDTDIYLDESGSVRIGEALIPPAYMTDNAGAYSDSVGYSLENTDEGYVLTVTPDREWLEAEDRAYPVVIDPTLKTDSPAYGDVSDAYVRSALPNFNSNNYYLLHVGNDSTDPQMYKLRSFFRINNLPPIPKAARILSAVISLQQAENGYWYSFDSSYSTYLTVLAGEVTSDWSEATITWNNQPAFSDTVIDYSISGSDSAEIYLDFDITSCMQKWYEDSSTNHGIVLRSATEQYDGFTTFISADDVIFSSTNPSFCITYYDTKGLESRWAYAAEDVGTAGTVYVNLFNGQPVLTGPGLSTQDELIPYSVYPVYNGYLSDMQFAPDASNINAPVTVNFNANVGKGFKLSCWESIKFKTIDGTSYVCYNDADGTELYFRYYTGQGYLSEDGYDLKFSYLLMDPYCYSIYDSIGNVKYFNSSGRISAISDEYGNKKIFNYDASNRLVSISFQSKTMSAAEQQITLSYNSANALTRITNAKNSSEYVDFYYSTTVNGSISQTCSGYLRTLRLPNGNFAEYQYDSAGRLSYVKQGGMIVMCGTYAGIEYDDEGKVSAIRQYGSAGVQGNKCSFAYDHKKAIVQTAGQDDVHGNSDDLLSVYLFDNYGNTVCSYLTDLSGETVYGASSAEYTAYDASSDPKANNSVTKSGSKGQYLKNLVVNGNLESVYNWTQTLNNVNCIVDATEHLYGACSVFLLGTNAACSGTLSQNVTITEPGTYTLSAYVKSSLLMMGYQNGSGINGAYITLDGSRSEIISGPTNTGIQNGWKKLSVTKDFSSAGTYTVTLELSNMIGTVRFDGVCLVKDDTAAAGFNYVSNLWTSLSGTLEPQNNGSVRLSCDPGETSAGYTVLTFSKPASKTAFMLSGWSKGFGVPEKDTSDYPPSMANSAHSDRFWGLEAIIHYTDGDSESQRLPFNPAVENKWQYISGVIIPQNITPTKTVSQVVVYIRYENNANHAFFKDVCLEETDTCAYEYNENGKVSKIRNTVSSSELSYSGTDVSGVYDSLGNSISYTYVPNKHKVLTATDAQGITATYGYNTNGLANSVTIAPSSGSGQMSSSAVYDNYGNLTSKTDTLGHATTYGYDTNRGLLSYVTNANNHRTQYLYDLCGKLTEVFADADKDGIHDSGEEGVRYIYNYLNYLTEIYNGETTYHLAYDNFGNVTSVTVGSASTPLVSYTYAGGNGKLLSAAYADGTVISNTYDAVNRIESVSYNGITAYTVTYDGDGNIDSYTDCATGRVYRYEYDALGREIRFFVTLNGAELYAAEKAYDANGRSVGYNYTIGGIGSRTASSTYDQYNRLSQETTAGGDTISYTYDGFGRVVTKTTGVLSEHYEYKTVGNNTSALLSKISYKRSGTLYKTVSYTYDDLGNILTEDDGTTFRQYTYDSLNQLASDLYYDKTTNLGEMRIYFYGKSGNVGYYVFSYDNGVYASAGVSGQSYGSGTDWKELLTSFNGTPITYDANGNPLSYCNGQSYVFTWQKGRQLASANTNNIRITYSYDVTGKRISKTVGGTVHDYTYDGSLLLCDKWGSEYVEYFYDASGSPYALNYFNGTAATKYYFVKNVEGDILELRTESNALAAKYIYDCWGRLLEVRDAGGNPITSTTHIANLNILRYRGYVYDAETKLYYLESRYYDPQTQRFISPDSFDYLGYNGDIAGYNMYAYCGNNPTNLIDVLGTNPEWFKTPIKWITKNMVKPIVKSIQNALAQINLTYSNGLNVSGTPEVAIINISGGILLDTKGNIALSASFGEGVTGGSASISASSYQSLTNAPSIDNLSNVSYQIGGSYAQVIYGVPAYAGVDLSLIPDSKKRRGYFGYTRNLGVGSPGAEVHFEVCESFVSQGVRINVFDMAGNIYRKIMEW